MQHVQKNNSTIAIKYCLVKLVRGLKTLNKYDTLYPTNYLVVTSKMTTLYGNFHDLPFFV